MLLRTCLLLTLVALSYGAPPVQEESYEVPQPYVYEKEIEEILKNLSATLRPMDPYVIREVAFNVDTDLVRAEFEAKDIVLRGFSVFQPTQIKNTITVFPPGVKTTFNIKLDELHVIVPYYYLDGMAVFVPFYGSGSVNLVAKEVHGGAQASVSITTSGKVNIRELSVKLNISSTSLYITGIIHNEPLSQIVSTSTTECFSEFVNLYNEKLGKTLGDLLKGPIMDIINKPKDIYEEDTEEDDEEDDLESLYSQDELTQSLQNSFDEIVKDKTNLNLGPSKINFNIKN